MAPHASAVASAHAPPLSRLAALLGVEPGEGLLVGGLSALYCVLILGVVFVQTIAFALFIGEFGVGSLPYSYLTIAALASLVAFGSLRLARRISFRASLLINLAFLTVGCTLLWLALQEHRVPPDPSAPP